MNALAAMKLFSVDPAWTGTGRHTMKCSICGTDNHDEVDFCRHCGVSITRTAASPAPPVAATATCAQCHRSYATPARFCDQCGTRLPARFEGVSAPAEASIDNTVTPRRNAAAPAPKHVDSSDTAQSRSAPPGFSLAVSASRSMAETVPPSRTSGARLRRAGARLWRQAMHWFALDAADGIQVRRQLRLIAGLSVALIGIVLSGFLLARTLIVGAPPWQGPTRLAEADLALIAAAETAQEMPAALPDNTALRGSEGVGATGTPSPGPNPAATAVQEDGANDTPKPVTSGTVVDQTAYEIPLSETASVDIAGTSEETAGTLPEPESPLIASVPLPANSQIIETGQADAARPTKPKRIVRPQPSAKDNVRQRNERRPARLAKAPAGWYAAMKTQLHRCASDPNLLTRVFCTEKTKFRYCSPNRWGQVAECVKTQYRDTSGVHHLGRWRDVEAGLHGQG
jgi:hypothetical protein